MNMHYLKYKMQENSYNSENLARVIGISVTSLYKRMKGQVDWYAREMKVIKDALQLSDEEFNKIFGL